MQIARLPTINEMLELENRVLAAKMRKSSDSNPASSRFAVRQVIGIARDAPSAEVAGVVLRKDLHPQPKVRVAVDALTRLTAETPPIFNTGDIVE